MGTLQACARGPQLQTLPALGLRRVVVYRNGVAYFERAGHVSSDNVEFRVRQREVGDFLATLAVMESGGSSVRSAAFPLPRDPQDGQPAPSPDERRTVRMALDGRNHDLVVGYMAETPIWRPSYRLVMGANDVQLQAFGVVQNLSGEDWTNVNLSLVTGAPVSFRSELAEPVITERPLVTDRGEVIDAVPQSESTLAEGQGGLANNGPVAAAAPTTPMRDVDGDGVADANDRYDEESELDDLRSTERSRSAARRPLRQGFAGQGRAAGGSVATRGFGDRAQAQQPSARIATNRYPRTNGTTATTTPRFEGPSRPRSVASLAAVAVQGGVTRYDIPTAITVPNHSATMVLLAARDVPGERLYLFAPDGGVSDSTRHPFNVARFVNRTGAMLERGPLAIFEAGAFLGQGLLDPLPNEATAVVPFALERGLAVESTSTFDVEGARLLRIRRGEVQIERFRTTRTTYTVRNGMDRDARVLIRTPTPEGTSLFEPPTGTESANGSALVPVRIATHGRSEQLIVARSPFSITTNWADRQAVEAIRAFIAQNRAPRDVIDALRTALELQEQVTSLSGQRDEEMNRLRDLQINSQETRDNLEAIRRNPGAADLRARLTARLAQVSGQIDQITRHAVDLDTQIGERRVRLSEAVRTIDVDATSVAMGGPTPTAPVTNTPAVGGATRPTPVSIR